MSEWRNFLYGRKVSFQFEIIIWKKIKCMTNRNGEIALLKLVASRLNKA